MRKRSSHVLRLLFATMIVALPSCRPEQVASPVIDAVEDAGQIILRDGSIMTTWAYPDPALD